MAASNSLVNIGELSKPATVLIEKISEAIGGICKPWQLKRVAKAEAEVALIKSQSAIEVTDLQERALRRFITEEAKHQQNMEDITAKALPDLEEKSKPENIEDDWISNFFDKCRLISDDEMQKLWSKILAGEANSPGTYSKRTVNYLTSLDKDDATLFMKLLSFSCYDESFKKTPMIFDVSDKFINQSGLKFSDLSHLDDVGLISFSSSANYSIVGISKNTAFFFDDDPVVLSFKNESNNQVEVGKVILTKAGQQLAAICESIPAPDFMDYVLSHWRNPGLIFSSPYPRFSKRIKQAVV